MKSVSCVDSILFIFIFSIMRIFFASCDLFQTKGGRLHQQYKKDFTLKLTVDVFLGFFLCGVENIN